MLNLGLANLSVDSNFIQIIKGMVLLLAVAFDVRSKLQGRPSFIGMMMSGMNRTSSPPPVVVTPPDPDASPDELPESKIPVGAL